MGKCATICSVLGSSDFLCKLRRHTCIWRMKNAIAFSTSASALLLNANPVNYELWNWHISAICYATATANLPVSLACSHVSCRKWNFVDIIYSQSLSANELQPSISSKWNSILNVCESVTNVVICIDSQLPFSETASASDIFSPPRCGHSAGALNRNRTVARSVSVNRIENYIQMSASLLVRIKKSRQ